jgi:3-hydroxybutyryl-CoA dehydrogenase
MKISRVGVVGAGAMGTGIAQVALLAGCSVIISDNYPESIAKSKGILSQNLNKMQDKGKLTAEQVALLNSQVQWTDSNADLHDCEIIIEAIIEELPIKKKLFAELESIVSNTCILASNTSSLSITSIAAACKNPVRVVGIHFFNPAPIMELVELIPAIQSDAAVLSTAKATIDGWGKRTVIAKDTPGFIVNRIARPFYSEALRILEEGIADCQTIDQAMTQELGFKMGPFALMDFIGHDVNFRVTESVFNSFYYEPRYKPSFTQKRLFEAGWLGRKSGKGFYDYSSPTAAQTKDINPALAKEISERILLMLINEAADALYWQVASAADIDLSMTKGVNYPKGLLAWADELGIAHCVNLLDSLYETYHEDRYRCSPLLRKKAMLCETFY